MMKPEPKLMHMPTHIKQKITDSARNVGTKLAISQMSKGFLSLAKDSPSTLEKVTVKIFMDKLAVTLNARFFKPVPDCFKRWEYDNSDRKKLVMEFSAHEEGVLMRNTESDWQKTLSERDYRKAAVQYVLGIMGPKTTIEKFVLEVDDTLFKADHPRDPESRHFSALYPKKKFKEDRKVILDEFESSLRKCIHQLLVEEIILCIEMTEPQMLQLILYLEPATLRFIDLFHCCPRTFAFDKPILNLEQLSETEQWKKTKTVRMTSYVYESPLNKFTHLERIFFCWKRPQLSMKAMIELFLSRSTFELWSISSEERFEQAGVKDYLTEFEPKRLESEKEGHMEVEMFLPNEPKTTIKMFLTPLQILLRRS